MLLHSVGMYLSVEKMQFPPYLHSIRNASEAEYKRRGNMAISTEGCIKAKNGLF